MNVPSTPEQSDPPQVPGMSPARRRMIQLTALAACAGAGAWYAWEQLQEDPGQAAVPLLFTQTLADATDQPRDLAAFKGRPLVVNFWATWCAPCVDEMPELSAFHQEVSASGASVIGIGVDSPSNIRQFAAKHQFAYPLLVGGLPGAELARQLGNPSVLLPFTVVISPSGKIVHRRLGRIRLPELRSALESARTRR